MARIRKSDHQRRRGMGHTPEEGPMEKAPERAYSWAKRKKSGASDPQILAIRDEAWAKALTTEGYRRVSERIIARIDRPSWRSHLVVHLGKQEVVLRVKKGHNMHDYFRRHLSEDVLTVPPQVAALIPPSLHDTTEYGANPKEQKRNADFVVEIVRYYEPIWGDGVRRILSHENSSAS